MATANNNANLQKSGKDIDMPRLLLLVQEVKARRLTRGETRLTSRLLNLPGVITASGRPLSFISNHISGLSSPDAFIAPRILFHESNIINFPSLWRKVYWTHGALLKVKDGLP